MGVLSHPATTVVAAGRGELVPGAPVNVAVPFAATYRAEGEIAYGRDDNAVWKAFEEALGALEGGHALAFGSGMAAIAAVLETLPVGSIVVAPADAYSGTRRFLEDAAGRGRLDVRRVEISDTKAVLRACQGARLLWVESPTNPLMNIADISTLSTGAHERGTAVVVDNTLATPLCQRPLDLGADVVVHSVTKYLSGHSDVLMGATVVKDPGWAEALLRRRTLHGGIPGPMEAFLALRGIRTLAVRVQRAESNAAELALRLSTHPTVTSVRYPGLRSHPGHAVAAQQMSGFGSMVSFEVDGGRQAADALCAAVRVCVHGTSLGGVETLIERRQRWAGEENLPPGLLRLSVGIEFIEDLWEDLAWALALAAGSGVSAASPLNSP